MCECCYISFLVIDVVKNGMVLLGELPSMKILLRDRKLPVQQLGISVAMGGYKHESV
jgi:hypothetical protein